MCFARLLLLLDRDVQNAAVVEIERSQCCRICKDFAVVSELLLSDGESDHCLRVLELSALFRTRVSRGE